MISNMRRRPEVSDKRSVCGGKTVVQDSQSSGVNPSPGPVPRRCVQKGGTSGAAAAHRHANMSNRSRKPPFTSTAQLEDQMFTLKTEAELREPVKRQSHEQMH